MERFPPFDITVRILVAAGCGLLAGLERQWAHKEIGVRTFTIVSLLGAFAALISPPLVVAAFAGVVVLVALASVQKLIAGGAPETTTAAALMITFALGVLAGQGHVFTPSAAVILVTLLLSLKPQLSRFAVGLSQEEVRGAVLLGLTAFVIYPVLPNQFVDPWGLFNPREAWLIIVLISAIGFVNYVLLRLFSGRGLYYTAIFGGLVNSTAAIAELAPLMHQAGADEDLAIAVNLLTVISMFGRNLVLLAIFSRTAGPSRSGSPCRDGDGLGRPGCAAMAEPKRGPRAATGFSFRDPKGGQLRHAVSGHPGGRRDRPEDFSVAPA